MANLFGASRWSRSWTVRERRFKLKRLLWLISVNSLFFGHSAAVEADENGNYEKLFERTLKC